MSQDQHTFQRAVSASLLGLAIQLAVSGMLLLLGLRLDSALVTIAMFHAIGGTLLWVALAVVYQQHKLERIEALEADELAKRHGTDSSIFSTSAEDLSVARRRLGRLQKWALPVVSFVTAGFLVGIGIWQFVARFDLLSAKPMMSDQLDHDPKLDSIAGADAFGNEGVLLALFGGVAFVMFIVSRYVAGMAKVKEWQMLRGGAGYLMGVCLVCAMLALGYGLLLLPSPVSIVLTYMVAIVPAFMALIGLEMLLNLVLDVYRPRKVGELPRPAFDSRLLSFLTSPESIARSINDAINYQFGFEITHSWFWQLFTRALPALVLFSGAVLMSMSSLVFVDDGDQAVITSFGQLDQRVLEPGVHVKAPWPFASAQSYTVGRVQSVSIGSDIVMIPGEAILWDNKHSETEPIHLIVAPLETTVGEQDPADESDDNETTRAVTPSVALIDIEVNLHYQVSDLIQYLTHNDDPVRRLEALGNAELSRYLLSQTIDEWLSTSRRETGQELLRRIQGACEKEKLGVEVIHVSAASIHPPRDVASAFHEVIKAEHQRQILVDEARATEIATLVGAAGSVEEAEAIYTMIESARSLSGERAAAMAVQIERSLTRAGGEAAVVLAEAHGDRWQHENTELAAAMRFPQELAAYRAEPGVYRLREFLKVLLEESRKAKVYLILADPERFTVRFKLDEPASALPGLDPTATN